MVTEPSKAVLGKLLDLKKFIGNTLPESNVAISNLITRTDNQHLHSLQMDIIDNGRITSTELNKGGLYLNTGGLGKLAINFIGKRLDG